MNPWKRESWLLALIVTALFLLPSPVAAGSGSSAVSAGKVTVAGELSPAVPAGPVSPGVSSPLAPTNCPPQVSVPITLQNAYSMVTGSYDQMVQVNSTHYAPYLNANWSNVLFLLPNQTAIPAWIESGASPTADQTVVWLHMPSLSAAQSLTIYLVGVVARRAYPVELVVLLPDMRKRPGYAPMARVTSASKTKGVANPVFQTTPP